jgi:hypothetical protein
MDRELGIGIAIVVVSVLLDYLAFVLKIEFMQFVLTFLAGSFATYVVQHKLQAESEKRESRRKSVLVMRNRIYGPLFMTLSDILEDVGRSLRDTWYIESKDLDYIAGHYLFYTIRRALKDKLLEIKDRIDKYQKIHFAAQAVLIKEAREQARQTYKVDIGQAQNNAFLRLQIGETMTNSTTIEQLLFQRMSPSEFVEAEIKKWGNTLTVEVPIGGRNIDLDSFDRFYSDVLHIVEGNSLFQEEKRQRQALIAELDAYLWQIKPHVTSAEAQRIESHQLFRARSDKVQKCFMLFEL